MSPAEHDRLLNLVSRLCQSGSPVSCSEKQEIRDLVRAHIGQPEEEHETARALSDRIARNHVEVCERVRWLEEKVAKLSETPAQASRGKAAAHAARRTQERGV